MRDVIERPKVVSPQVRALQTTLLRSTQPTTPIVALVEADEVSGLQSIKLRFDECQRRMGGCRRLQRGRWTRNPSVRVKEEPEGDRRRRLGIEHRHARHRLELEPDLGWDEPRVR